MPIFVRPKLSIKFYYVIIPKLCRALTKYTERENPIFSDKTELATMNFNACTLPRRFDGPGFAIIAF